MTSVPFCSDEDAEVLLNEYLDGELPLSRQPDLYAHLAACADCRAQFDALLAFRLAVRQEPLPVPPSADAALFARLDRARRSSREAPSRQEGRAPLAGALRRRVSVGAALAVAGAAIVVASLAGLREAPPVSQDRIVETVLTDGPLYLIDPGVTVEARRARP